MKPGDRFRSRNTMFWRADEKLEAIGRERRWIDFHRACGAQGLFFDDIDPVNDDPKKDVTDRMRGRGYQAVAFRVGKDKGGHFIQLFVARGIGSDPVEAVLAAYRAAIEAGDPVTHGLDTILRQSVSPTSSPPLGGAEALTVEPHSLSSEDSALKRLVAKAAFATGNPLPVIGDDDIMALIG